MTTIEGIGIPDSKPCKEITELVRDTETELLFNHSSRVYCFGALTGLRRVAGLHVGCQGRPEMADDWPKRRK